MKIEVYEEKHTILLREDSKPAVKTELKLRAFRSEDYHRAEHKSEQKYSFMIDNDYKVSWEDTSAIFEDCKRVLEYTKVPFSLGTYLEWWKDPRARHFIVYVDSIKWQGDSDCTDLGQMTITTTAQGNPFILPVRTDARIERNITIRIAESVLGDGELFCSGQLISEGTHQGLREYIFLVGKNVDPDQICVYHHEDMNQHELLLKQQQVSIRVLSRQYIDDRFKLQLKGAILKIKKFYRPRRVDIVLNELTAITEAEGIVFLNGILGKPLEEVLLKSWLRLHFKEEWIVHGLATYTDDFGKKFANLTRLAELVEGGQQLIPLCDPSFLNDEVWQLRAKVVMAAISHIYGKNSFLESMMELQAQQELVYGSTFLRYIKNQCGLMNMDNMKRQFINSTGLPRIEYSYVHKRQSNDIRLTVTQTPLQAKYLQFYNFTRVQLERCQRLESTLSTYLIDKYEQLMNSPAEWPTKQEDLDKWLMVPMELASTPRYSRELDVVYVESDMEHFMDEQKLSFTMNKQLATIRTVERKKRHKQRGEDAPKSSPLTWVKLDQCWKMPSIIIDRSDDSYKKVYKLNKETSERELIRLLREVKRLSISRDVALAVLQKVKIQDTAEVVRREAVSVLPYLLTGNTSLEEEIWKVLSLETILMRGRRKRGDTGSHLYELALLRALGQIKQDISCQLQLEEFHKNLLEAAEFQEGDPFLSRQCEYRLELYIAMMSWRSRRSIEVVRCISKHLQQYEMELEIYLPMIRKLIPYLRQFTCLLQAGNTKTPGVEQLLELVERIIAKDTTGILKLDKLFEQLSKKEKSSSISEFIFQLLSKLESIKSRTPLLYEDALRQAYALLNSNRQRYALHFQLTVNNSSNILLASRLWHQLTHPTVLRNSALRFYWIKIYRLFYFYYTPACLLQTLGTIPKKKSLSSKSLQLSPESRSYIVEAIKDFNVSIEWLNSYFLPKDIQLGLRAKQSMPKPARIVSTVKKITNSSSEDCPKLAEDEDKGAPTRKLPTRKGKEARNRTKTITEEPMVTKLSNGEDLFMEEDDEASSDQQEADKKKTNK